MSPNQTALISDYVVFAEQRRRARPLWTVYIGFAVLALLGGLIGSVPRRESVEAAAVLLLPAGGLLLLNAWRWSRLCHRLGEIRAGIQQVGL